MLNSMSRTVIDHFSSDTELLHSALKWSKKASSKKKVVDHFVTYAEVLFATGDRSQAMKTIEKSIQLAKKNNEPIEPILNIKEKFENS